MFALVDQWRASGATKKAFCDEQEINIHTFSYWVTKRRRVDSGEPAGGFINVDVSGLADSAPVRITYPNGVVVSCPANLPLIGQLIRLA